MKAVRKKSHIKIYLLLNAHDRKNLLESQINLDSIEEKIEYFPKNKCLL